MPLYPSPPVDLQRVVECFVPLPDALSSSRLVYAETDGHQIALALNADGSLTAAPAEDVCDEPLAAECMAAPATSLDDDSGASCAPAFVSCARGCCLAIPVLTGGGMLRLRRPEGFGKNALPVARLFLSAASREIAAVRRLHRLARQVEFSEKIVQSMSSGFLVLLPDMTVTHANDAACELLNVPWHQLLNARLSDIVLSKLVVEDVFRTGVGVKDVESFIKLKNKTLHILKTAVPVLGHDGTVIAVLDHFREIREARQLVSKMTGTRASFTFEDIIHESPLMADAIAMGRMAATNDLSVLISGESGTGKELFAHAIHMASARRNAPFVVIDCASMPRELVPSELFGYAEGAFTGARRGGMPGKFELANGGTIFLDELGELPLEVQAQFLRVLQCREVVRIGGKEVLPVDIRIISASNRDLAQEVRLGNFREDLFYRLNVLSLHLPSLRARPKDIEPLAQLFVEKYASGSGRKLHLAPSVLKSLKRHPWPGNVRELENVIARSVHSFSGAGGDQITEIQLGTETVGVRRASRNGNHAAAPIPNQEVRSFRDLEMQAIQEAIASCGGNISLAAQRLGVARSTIYKKMATWNK